MEGIDCREDREGNTEGERKKEINDTKYIWKDIGKRYFIVLLKMHT